MDINKISFYPNITLDFFQLEQQNDNTRDIFVNNYIPNMNNATVALVCFENDNNLNGVSTDALGYTFTVYREDDKDNKLKYITKVTDGNLSLIDYNVANKHNYTYYVFKEDSNKSSAANISNTLETCWWNWSVTGLNKADEINAREWWEKENWDDIKDHSDLFYEGNANKLYYTNKDEVWNFKLNITSGDMTANISKTEYQTLGRFPKISGGKMNYYTGSLTCIIGDIENNIYVEKAQKMDDWSAFCNDGRPKLLKDIKGNKFLIDIISTSISTDNVTREQAGTMTFNWTQIGDASDVTIIGE